MPTNTEVITALYAAFGTGDIPTVLGTLTEDVSWTEAEGFPYGGTYLATGKSFAAPFVHIWKMRDGQAHTFRQVTDTVLVQAAMK
jgi:ketosteroid isomerase-like protein